MTELTQTELTQKEGWKTQGKKKYEVNFYVRYPVTRPSTEELTNLFNLYGEVDHIVCPVDKNYAFVYMRSLNTVSEVKRTQATIGKIIYEMPSNDRFYISVANSNKGKGQKGYNKEKKVYEEKRENTYVPFNKAMRKYN